MMLLNYLGDTGVHLDRCPACHGLWLDHQELERVQVLVERWADDAPEQIRSIAGQLEEAREQAARETTGVFQASRFSLVNALINRILDAA